MIGISLFSLKYSIAEMNQMFAHQSDLNYTAPCLQTYKHKEAEKCSACVGFVSLGVASELKFKSQNNQASVDFKMCHFLIAENTNVFFLIYKQFLKLPTNK